MATNLIPEEAARPFAAADAYNTRKAAEFDAALASDPLDVCRRMMALATTTADDTDWTEKRFLLAVEAAANIAAKVAEIERGRANVWSLAEIKAAWMRAQETGRPSWERDREPDDLENSWSHVETALLGKSI